MRCASSWLIRDYFYWDKISKMCWMIVILLPQWHVENFIVYIDSKQPIPGVILLTWINFNPSMDKSYVQQSVAWNYFSIP